jgi:hypothetical protein
VQADQAAGLRSQQLRHDLRVISLIDTPADFAPRLAQALMARDQKVLLIDSLGRHARTSKTQFIFGWQQQLAQQGLQTLSVNGVEVMHAPGGQAGDTLIVRASAKYHAVIFDACELQTTITLESRTPQSLLVALSTHHDTLAHAYALIKTLHQHKLDWQVILIGEAALAERVMAAVAHFLPAQSGMLEYMNLDADAHLHALAARISAAEWGASQLNTNTGGECAQHG